MTGRLLPGVLPVRAVPRVEPFPTETALQVASQAWIRDQWSGTTLKVHGNGRQTSGHPDLIACVLGRFVGIELKQPGERPTQLQYKRLREWEAAGGLAGWATTLVEVDALLGHVLELDWKNPAIPPVGAGL